MFIRKMTHGVALFGLFIGLCLGVASAQETPPIPQPNPPDIGRFDPAKLERKQDFIHVEGNHFVDEKGNAFVFRGVSVADPSRLEKEGQWKQSLFQEIHDWGANTVRLPVHPQAWRTRGRDSYLALIDQAVTWANKLDMYLIIDWHAIGFLATGDYQSESYFTDKRETFRFWHEIAYRYQDVPTTAAYELFNEPTTLKSAWGKEHWMVWKRLNETMIDTIYALDERVIPLVAGFNWAYDLTFVKDYPIERDGIAYVSHPYPQKANPHDKNRESYFRLWDEAFGYVARTYPMILTEIGWVREGEYGAHQPVIDDGTYGPLIMDYIRERGLSWIAWIFDPQWAPPMIKDWTFTPTEQGEFFKKSLQQAPAPSQPKTGAEPSTPGPKNDADPGDEAMEGKG